MHEWIEKVMNNEAELVSKRLFWFLFNNAHDPLDRTASKRSVAGLVTIDTLRFEQRMGL